MDKKFAIFDMDGTLIDSMGYWRNLAGEYLELSGIAKEKLTPELSERIKPLTVTDTAKLFIELFGIEKEPETIAKEINETMNSHYENDILLKDGAKEYLTRLKADGVKMCIASATAKNLVDKCLTRLGVRDDFEFLISCEEVGTGKNKPDVYLEAAKRLGAEPQDIAVYEDAVFAGRTAKKSGFYLVGVYDSYAKSGWDEMKLIADELIDFHIH